MTQSIHTCIHYTLQHKCAHSLLFVPALSLKAGSTQHCSHHDGRAKQKTGCAEVRRRSICPRASVVVSASTYSLNLAICSLDVWDWDTTHTAGLVLYGPPAHRSSSWRHRSTSGRVSLVCDEVSLCCLQKDTRKARRGGGGIALTFVCPITNSTPK